MAISSITRPDGANYEFQINLDTAFAEATTIRWEIHPTAGAFPLALTTPLTGTLDFSTSETSKIVSPALTRNHPFPRDFEIQLYVDDTLAFTSSEQRIAGDASLPDNSRSISGGGDQNVIGLGLSDTINPASGGSGDDTFIITRFQYGTLEIDDVFTSLSGQNLIKFDYGVTITAYREVSFTLFDVVVDSVTLTLSTGAVVTIALPAGSFGYQLGSSGVLTYADFKTEIGATGMDSLRADYAITSFTDAPELSDPRLEARVARSLSGAGNEDIITAASDYNLTVSGGSGDDVFVITRFQYGTLEIDDVFTSLSGQNLIKFDYGVTITAYREVSFTLFDVVIDSVTLTLSTGAVVTIALPAGSFGYQLGSGNVLTYAEFKAAIEATGASDLAGDFTISASPVTFTPIATEALEIDENDGTWMLQLAATSEDNDGVTSPIASYEFVGDSSGFTIDNNGLITLTTRFDYEDASTRTHTLTVRATDSRQDPQTRDITFTLRVQNVQEGPAEYDIMENQAGTMLSVALFDADPTSATYSEDPDGRIGGVSFQWFTTPDGGTTKNDITGITDTTSATLDIEGYTPPSGEIIGVTVSYQDPFNVEADDRTEFDVLLSPIVFLDGTDPVASYAGSINEDSTAATLPTIAARVDNAPQASTFTYEFVTDVDAGTTNATHLGFTIDEQGALTFTGTASTDLDYDTDPVRDSITLRVRATYDADGTGNAGAVHTRDVQVVIAVNDLNDKPVLSSSGTTATINENSVGAVTGITFTITDADSVGTLQYNPVMATTPNDDNNAIAGMFEVDTESGALRLRDVMALDREHPALRTSGEIGLTITATDGVANSDPIEVIITVNDLNDAMPVFKEGGATREVMVTETTPVGAIVIDANPVVDGDATTARQSLEYSLIGDTGGVFRLDRNTGQVTLAEALNFEDPSIGMLTDGSNRKGFVITLLADAGDGLTARQDITVVIEDVDDEDPAFGTLAWQEGTGSNQAGEEHIRTINENISGTVLSIPISDVDTAGADLILRIEGGGTLFTFTKDSGNANGILSINSGALDYETTTSHTLTLVVTDSNDQDPRMNTRIVIINVGDVNEADPVVTITPTMKTIDELTAPAGGEEIATFTVADADTDKVYASSDISISGDPDNRFEIIWDEVNQSGVVRLEADETLDYEDPEDISISLTITATDTLTPTDGLTGFGSAEIEIMLQNKNNPVFGTGSVMWNANHAGITEDDNDEFAIMVQERTSDGRGVAATTVLANLEASDLDGDTLTYSVANGPTIDINGTETQIFTIDNDNELILNAALDYETATSYTITLVATDEDGETGTQQVTINVGPLDEDDATFEITSTGNVAIPVVGDILEVARATENGDDLDGNGATAPTYKWFRYTNGDDITVAANRNIIANATGTTYMLADADIGNRIGVLVEYTDGGGHEESLPFVAPLTADVLFERLTGSVVEDVNVQPSNQLQAEGRLNISDPAITDITIGGDAFFVRDIGSLLLADSSFVTLEYDKSTGDFRYIIQNNDPDIQLLKTGDAIVETFTFEITRNGGTPLETKEARIIVSGADEDIYFVDDGNEVAGTATTISLPDPATINGALSISAEDAVDITTDGVYGSLEYDAATRLWQYTLNHAHADVQGLAIGATLTDTIILQITPTGGAATPETITINIERSAEGIYFADGNGEPIIMTGGRLTFPHSGTTDIAVTDYGNYYELGAFARNDPDIANAEGIALSNVLSDGSELPNDSLLPNIGGLVDDESSVHIAFADGVSDDLRSLFRLTPDGKLSVAPGLSQGQVTQLLAGLGDEVTLDFVVTVPRETAEELHYSVTIPIIEYDDDDSTELVASKDNATLNVVEVDGSTTAHSLGITFTVTNADTPMFKVSVHGKALDDSDFAVKQVGADWTLLYIGEPIAKEKFLDPIIELDVTLTSEERPGADTETISLNLNDGTYLAYQEYDDDNDPSTTNVTNLFKIRDTDDPTDDPNDDPRVTPDQPETRSDLVASDLLILDENYEGERVDLSLGRDIYSLTDSIAGGTTVYIDDISFETDIIRLTSKFVFKEFEEVDTGFGPRHILTFDTDGDTDTDTDEVKLEITPSSGNDDFGYEFQRGEFGEIQDFETFKGENLDIM